MPGYKRGYTWGYMRIYMRVHVRGYMQGYMQGYVRGYMWSYLRGYMQGYMHSLIRSLEVLWKAVKYRGITFTFTKHLFIYDLLSSLTFHEQREFVWNDRLDKVIQVARVNTGVALCHLFEVQLISLKEKKRKTAHWMWHFWQSSTK